VPARIEVIGATLENLFSLLINAYDSWVFLKTFKIVLLFLRTLQGGPYQPGPYLLVLEIGFTLLHLQSSYI